ncbi:hypothetical protein BD779DRAFT_49515 [Infundibulicybe gibba]|nr:hypothetical protein BD779DRAFT_49515 [Infundibulicybe gibba]
MNALRAKEAWEMERLWKARSMYGNELNGAAPLSSMNIVGSPSSVGSDDLNSQSAVHGSSHTSFSVQKPFQNAPPHIYHSMPTGPPPIIYSPTQASTSRNHNNYRSFPDSKPTPDRPSLVPTSRTANPLPEPPRESPYAASLLSPASTEYRNIYPGVTTAH